MSDPPSSSSISGTVSPPSRVVTSSTQPGSGVRLAIKASAASSDQSGGEISTVRQDNCPDASQIPTVKWLTWTSVEKAMA